MVHAARSTEWFHDSLHAFRVVFVAIFFISVGMMIDLNFLKANWQTIAYLVGLVFITNQLINAGVLRSFGNSWQESIYGGALLAQIGELSFILSALAFSNNIITQFGYQTTILVIALTLLISPLWIGLTRMLVNKTHESG